MFKTDLTGDKFGFWTVLKRDTPRKGARNSYWLCECKCGTIKSISRSSLISGKSQSCGCKPNENRKGINKTHGMSGTRLFHEWCSMKRRCKTRNGKDAPSYYSKGITVCAEWSNSFLSFYNWAISNGYNDSLTIDRIDNSKGYSPNNCRWVTIEEQTRNRTNTIFVMYKGKKTCLRTLCTSIGFPYKTAHRRYTRWKTKGKEITVEKLLEPIRKEKVPYKYRNQS